MSDESGDWELTLRIEVARLKEYGFLKTQELSLIAWGRA
jgi:hypothetical protein